MRNAKRDVIDTGKEFSEHEANGSRRENGDCISCECYVNKRIQSQLVSRNHCDTSGDPARTVPEKRRVPNKRRQEFKTQRFRGPDVNMSEVKTLQEKLEDKLKMLKFTAEDTEKYVRPKM